MRQSFRFFIHLLPYSFVFIASFYIPNDPDLGWHLKYGEYFFQHHQILRENIYSALMPHFYWANGSWGTDLLTYFIFHSGGFLALTIVSALVVTCTFFLFAQAARLSFVVQSFIFPLVVYLEIPENIHSFRGQQLSLLFLGLLFFLLSRHKIGSKILFFVPVLFFFWVNLHEESLLGLSFFALWVLIVGIKHSLEQKRIFLKENKFLLLVFVVSSVATFVNPFGWNIHLDLFSHLGDPLLKRVIEYIPFTPFTLLWWNQFVVLLLFLGGVSVLYAKKQLTQYSPFLTIFALLLFMSLTVRRIAWPAYYFLLPFFSIVWQSPKKQKQKILFVSAVVVSCFSFFCVGYTKLPFTQYSQVSWTTYCQLQTVPCSQKSADYLQKHALTKHLFTYYDWGGFLIWNYPQIQPTIDGRMLIWREENGYSAAAEYDAYINAQKNIEKSSYDVIYLPLDRALPLYRELNELAIQGKWKLLYDDGKAGIIVRVKNK